MKYYMIDQLSRQDQDYCAIRTVPEQVNNRSFMLSKGMKIRNFYPEKAIIYMSNRHAGIVLTDFISNTRSILPVSKKMKEIIEEMTTNEIEYLPFNLYNHKKRLAGKDYFIINIIGGFDCLNLEESDITWFEGDIVDIDEFVLDKKKMENAPHLFRVKETPHEYVVSEELAAAFAKHELTNINLEELEVK